LGVSGMIAYDDDDGSQDHLQVFWKFSSKYYSILSSYETDWL